MADLGCIHLSAAFLVTDIMNRVYGPSTARKVVLAGFVTGVVFTLIGTQIQGEFGPLVTLRIAMGSGIAFLTAQLLDVAIFDRLREGRWYAPLVSTLVGSAVDTALFFTIAFSASLTFLEPANDVSWANEMPPLLGQGPVSPLWVSLAVADWMVACTCINRFGAISPSGDDRTRCVNSFDSYKICANLRSSATFERRWSSV